MLSGPPVPSRQVLRGGAAPCWVETDQSSSAHQLHAICGREPDGGISEVAARHHHGPLAAIVGKGSHGLLHGFDPDPSSMSLGLNNRSGVVLGGDQVAAEISPT